MCVCGVLFVRLSVTVCVCTRYWVCLVSLLYGDVHRVCVYATHGCLWVTIGTPKERGTWVTPHFQAAVWIASVRKLLLQATPRGVESGKPCV